MAQVLLVDDDALLREFVRKVLERAGYDVEEAADGTAALKAYGSQPSDVVITDIVMPNTEGLSTIRGLRRLDRNVKIIAISGGGFGSSDDYLEVAQKMGATRVLAKPFTAQEILTVVADVLAGRSPDKDPR